MDAQLVLPDPARLSAQVAQHLEDVLDVRDPWRVRDRARLIAQNGRCHELQDRVLGT